MLFACQGTQDRHRRQLHHPCKPGNRSQNVSTNFRTDCLGCHVPAKDTDWIYTEAYPTLTAQPESSR
jgi:hypothetical protein